MKAYYSLLSTFLLSTLYIQGQTPSFSIQVTQGAECGNTASASAVITGGTAPFTVIWFQPTCEAQGFDTMHVGMEVSNLGPNYYYAAAYDANVFLGYQDFSIPDPFFVTNITTNETCLDANGTVKILVQGTVGPYLYQWSNGVVNGPTDSNIDSITNLSAGNYAVLITDGNGCTFDYGGSSDCLGDELTQLIKVLRLPKFSLTMSSTASNCFDGTATISVTNAMEPVSYQWNIVPEQTTATATGLSPGSYFCLVSDASECSRLVHVTVPEGPNYIQIGHSFTTPICPLNNGEITLHIMGGIPPYSVEWSNGASSPSINNLSPGTYTAVVTDAQGCTRLFSKTIGQINPILITTSYTLPSCLNNDATISAEVSGGQPPYIYQWDNGGNGPSLNGLSSGVYKLTVTDANGCQNIKLVYIPTVTSCLSQISGRVMNDVNADCEINNGEFGLANVIVKAMPGNYFSSTNNQGKFSFSLPPGNYTLQQVVPNHFSQVCPDTQSAIEINANNPDSVIQGVNFYNQAPSLFSDVAVYVTLSPINPAIGHSAFVTVKNLGVNNVTPSLSFTHHPLLQFTGAVPSANSFDGQTNTATFNVPLLPPQATALFIVNYTPSLDALNHIGEVVSATANVSILNEDINMQNNTFTAYQMITAAYDPNDKQVWPAGEGEDGRITLDERLFTYKIRFQNTGNDTAFTVIVRDTLDLDLDVSTFKLGAVSHPMEYTIRDHGTLTFTFNNIKLPDSTTNEPLSHGEINYTIQSLPHVGYGAQIRNTAAIYFDYNPPIITNTTVNTYYNFSTGILSLDNSILSILPNPTQGTVHTKAQLAEDALVSFQITDMQGRVIFRKGQEVWPAGASEHVFPLGQYATQAGIYLMNYTVNSKQYQFKVVLQ